MCNTYRFQSIQNNCKDFDKCWHWNHRIDEETSTYNETTKWTYQRKKLFWPQTRWGYSIVMLSWTNKISVTAESCHTHNFISCENNNSWQTPKPTLYTTPVTPPNTPSKPVIHNILTKRPLSDTEKGNMKKIQKDVVIYNFHDKIDDSQLLASELNST